MIQEAVRQALLTMGTPLPQLGMDLLLPQPAPHLTLSASALELAEAAHAAQGKRLKETRELQKTMEAERARKEAEAVEQATQASGNLQAQLQVQLQQLAAEEAAAAQEFAKKGRKWPGRPRRSPSAYTCSRTTSRLRRRQAYQP